MCKNRVKIFHLINQGRLLLVSFAFILNGCIDSKERKIAHYDFHQRVEEISNPEIQLTPTIVDLCINFDKIVSANSGWRRTKEEAMDGAQFNALQQDSTTHTLIAPIYSILEETEIQGQNKITKYDAQVIAFSGQYCGQYSLIQALDNASKINQSTIAKYELLEGACGQWTEDPFHIGEVYIIQNNNKSPEIDSASNNDNTPEIKNSQLRDSSLTKINEAKTESSRSDSKISTDSIKNSSKENVVDSIGNFTNKDSQKIRQNQILQDSTNQSAKLLSNDSTQAPSITSEKFTLDQQAQKLYAESIIRDSTEKIIKNGKKQLDFILHNDDYITRWMKENESLKKQLVMFLRIQENESSFIDLKYKAKRNEKEDLEWGKIDYYLLELEYLNRNKLLFYSNFNLLRSRKLVEDCYLNATDSTRKVVKKYMDIAENWLAEGNIPMQINSDDQLLKSGLPIRKRINAEYFAAEIYYRAWEICQGKKLDFLTDTLSWAKEFNPLNDSVQWKEDDSNEKYAIKNDNSAKFNEKEFPKGSYLDLMQRAINLPDTLKSPIFSTYPNNSIPKDFDFPTNITYPRGIIYVVQVGAFRKKIEPSFYKKFAPVVKEAKGDGVYRYTAGFFPKYGSAQIALRQIKQFGYKDAFIVALKDGERIPLPEKSVRLR